MYKILSRILKKLKKYLIDDDESQTSQFIMRVGADMNLWDASWPEAYNMAMGRLELANQLRSLPEMSDYDLSAKLTSQECIVRFQIIQYIMTRGYKYISTEYHKMIKKNDLPVMQTPQVCKKTIENLGVNVEAAKNKNFYNCTIKAQTLKHRTITQKMSLNISEDLLMKQVITVNKEGGIEADICTLRRAKTTI